MYSSNEWNPLITGDVDAQAAYLNRMEDQLLENDLANPASPATGIVNAKVAGMIVAKTTAEYAVLDVPTRTNGSLYVVSA